MEFDALLSQVLALLQHEKRVSYRALKRRFQLDDEYLADLKAESIQAKRLACGKARGSETKRGSCWGRFMVGSPRGLIRLI